MFLFRPKYDVFISYRRDRGANLAEKIKLFLTGKGYRCFFDKSEIHKGRYACIIRNAVRKSRYFILVLTDGTIERCCKAVKSHQDDYVYEEIKAAFARKLFRKTVVIPVVGDSERNSFPTDEELTRLGLSMPDDIKAIREYHIVRISESEFFDVTMERFMIDQLGWKPRSLARQIFCMVCVFAALLTAWLLCFCGDYEEPIAESETLSGLSISRNEQSMEESSNAKAPSSANASAMTDKQVIEHDLKCLLTSCLDPMVEGSREEVKRLLSIEYDNIYDAVKSIQHDMQSCLDIGMTEEEILRLKPVFVKQMTEFRANQQAIIDGYVANGEYEQALRYWTTVNMVVRKFDGTPFKRPKLSD